MMDLRLSIAVTLGLGLVATTITLGVDSHPSCTYPQNDIITCTGNVQLYRSYPRVQKVILVAWNHLPLKIGQYLQDLKAIQIHADITSIDCAK